MYSLSLLGYCLMSNHVHLIAVPGMPDSLAQTLKQVHGRYASYWNTKRSTSGHVWQGRFYSCPLDETHVWEALRYAELNPVRAGLTESASAWPWSSALAHCTDATSHPLLAMPTWQNRWTPQEWQEFLESRYASDSAAELRRCTHTGRPMGNPEFVAQLETRMLRILAPRRGGRPKKVAGMGRQLTLASVARAS
ncbi:MAG TPA: transposase [Terriglobales bacterium]|nr:transposase [Terriglobales bacterium]